MGTSSDLSPDQTQKGWDAVVDTYEEAVEPFTLQFSEEALRLVNLKPRERVLDVAAGPGGLSIAAAKRGADVVSIDFSPAMTRRLRTRIAQENLVNVTAETMDGQSMDFSDDAFDVAFSVFGSSSFRIMPRACTRCGVCSSLEDVLRSLPGVRPSGLASSKALWVL